MRQSGFRCRHPVGSGIAGRCPAGGDACADRAGSRPDCFWFSRQPDRKFGLHKRPGILADVIDRRTPLRTEAENVHDGALVLLIHRHLNMAGPGKFCQRQGQQPIQTGSHKLPGREICVTGVGLEAGITPQQVGRQSFDFNMPDEFSITRQLNLRPPVIA